MRILTKEDLGNAINIVMTKPCKISKDLEGKKNNQTKSVSLEFNYSGLTLNDIMEKCIKSDTIDWQRVNRGNYDVLNDGETIQIDVANMAKANAEMAYVKKILGMDKNDALKEIKRLEALIK